MKYHQIVSVPHIAVVLIITWCLASSSSAQFFELTSHKMRLWADHIVVNRSSIEARGDVYIRQSPYSIYAGYIHINLNTNEINAEKSVLAQFNSVCISGNRLYLNINTQTGIIHQGTLFYEQGPLYIKGNKIEKTSENTYRVDDVQVTGCDLCDPDWSISGKDVHITIDGYARLWHGRMSVKNVPIFYTPYFIFPVKQDRQSGLLFPFVEHSSRKGWLYQQPFYWAIGNSCDATIYTTFMEKRGIMNGLEFRYNTGIHSKGTFMIDYLDDRQQETVDNTSVWGYHNDDYLRLESKRYWIRTKIDHPMFFKTMLHLDADWISDPDYLKTFDTGYTGFNNSRDELFRRHNRNIDDSDETFRFNRLMINRKFELSRIYGEFQWFDEVYHQNHENHISQIQHLPIIRFSKIQSPLGALPVFYDLDIQYAYEYQKDAEKYHNLYMAPGITCPLNIFPYFSLEQSFQWKGGYLHSHSHTATAHQNLFKTCITSELYKIYSFGSNHAKNNAKKEFKHSIRLVTTYTHASDIEESLEQFRLFDEKSNTINWLISNTWTEKILTKQTRNNLFRTEYKQRVKLAFSGDYDILDDNSMSDLNNSRAFSPIKMDFFWHSDVYSFDADALWSVYDDELIQYHMSLDMDDNDENQLKIQYQYCMDNNESINTELLARLYSKLNILADYAHDIHSNQRIQHGLGFEYKGSCWRMDGMYHDNADTDDRSFSVMIHLDGISN